MQAFIPLPSAFILKAGALENEGSGERKKCLPVQTCSCGEGDVIMAIMQCLRVCWG